MRICICGHREDAHLANSGLGILTRCERCECERFSARQHRRVVAALILAVTFALAVASAGVTASASSATTLSPTEAAGFLRTAGWPASEIGNGVAVGAAESGLDSAQVGGLGEEGWLQVYPAAHPDLARQFNLFDPLQNAQAALIVWERAGNSWDPWSTWKNGAAAKFAQLGADAAAGKDDPLTLSVSTSSGCPVGSTCIPGTNTPIPSVPSLDPTKVIYQAIAGLLYGVDQMLLGEFENIWNPMVASSDNLTGTESFGPGLVIDGTNLPTVWKLVLGIALGSLFVLIVTLAVLQRMVGIVIGGGGDMDAGKLIVYVLFGAVAAAFSLTLVGLVVDADNALTTALNGATAVELRDLPAFQGIGLTDPSAIQDVHTLIQAIVTLAATFLVVIELVILFVAYFIRLVLLWVLVAIAPLVAIVSVLPSARGLAVYWCRLLVATIFWKAVNVLVFDVLLAMGVHSNVALFNVLVLATLVFFMLMVPAMLMRALGQPHGAYESVRNTVTSVTVRRAYTEAGGAARRGAGAAARGAGRAAGGVNWGRVFPW